MRWKQNWLKLKGYILPEKTPPRKLRLEKVTEKKPWESKLAGKTQKIKNSFYVIVVILLDFWGNKKFSTINVNLKSRLIEKYFLATIFHSKIWVKTRWFHTRSFRSFSKNQEDITRKVSLTGSPLTWFIAEPVMIKSWAIKDVFIF